MSLAKVRFFDTTARLLSNNYKAIEESLTEGFRPAPGSRVLDLACGTGLFSDKFLDVEYVGVDFDADTVSYARERYEKNFEQMDARKLNFPDGFFDGIFSLGLFHHINDGDSLLALAEARRVLKNNGKFFVIEAVWPKNRANLIGYFLRKIDRGKHVRKEDGYATLFKKYFSIERSYTRRYGFFLELVCFLMRKV